MKLSFIEIAGFRGFKDRTRFDLPNGFAVLTGRNGVGKSTVLDAFDFALTGTINKYAVKGARGGGLNDHIWWVGEGTPEKQYVAVGFVDDMGEEFVIKRSRDRGLNMPIGAIVNRLCGDEVSPVASLETLMHTTLIRDELIAALSLDLPEQARFAAVRAAIGGLSGPDYTERMGAIVRIANSAKTEQEKRVTDARADLGRALSALTEAQSFAERQHDVAEAIRIIETVAPDLAIVSTERAELLRRRVAERKQSIPILLEAIAQAETLQSELVYLESDAGQAEIAAAYADVDAARQAKALSEERLLSTKRLEDAERESDSFANHMVALLEHGEAIGLQSGHCPLCNAMRNSEEFAAAITAARSNLRERSDRVTRVILEVEQSRQSVQRAETLLMAAEQRLAGLKVRQDSLSNNIDTVAR